MSSLSAKAKPFTPASSLRRKIHVPASVASPQQIHVPASVASPQQNVIPPFQKTPFQNTPFQNPQQHTPPRIPIPSKQQCAMCRIWTENIKSHDINGLELWFCSIICVDNMGSTGVKVFREFDPIREPKRTTIAEIECEIKGKKTVLKLAYSVYPDGKLDMGLLLENLNLFEKRIVNRMLCFSHTFAHLMGFLRSNDVVKMKKVLILDFGELTDFLKYDMGSLEELKQYLIKFQKIAYL